MEYNITKLEDILTCRAKIPIDNKKCFLKLIIGSNEEAIISEFINSINIITIKEKCNPQIFTFNRRDYMAFILSRIIKYNFEVKASGLPLNKWKIEDIRDKFGNFNDEYILFDYCGLEPIENKYFYLEELKKSNRYVSEFIKYCSVKIKNLSIIVSKMLDNTYSDVYGSKVVVSLEIEPIKEKKELFLKTFPYLKDESEDTILRYMKNNFAFSRLLGITICRISEKKYIENRKEE